MRLEAINMWTWRLYSSEFGDALSGHDQWRLEEYTVVDLEPVNPEAVNLQGVNLVVVNLEAVDLEAVDHEAVDLEAIDRDGGKMGAETLIIGWFVIVGM